MLTKAQERVANHIQNTEIEGLDPFLLIIEDALGYTLLHTQGDLSFLMPALPVIGQCLSGQLNPQIQDEYERRQTEVWELILVDGQQFRVAPNRNACILPFMARESKLTVTIFFISS